MKISISQAKQFKSCRMAYYFRYIENLVPVKDAEPLETGKRYHEYLERINAKGYLEFDEPTKEFAMAMAYLKHIYPVLKLKEVEKWFDIPLSGGEHRLIGRVDGIADDGCVVEHKTTSGDIGEEYEYNLLWDEQILAYMYAMDCRKVHYTVIRKPTIRLKKEESEEEFFQRMVEWYDEDTEKKIRTFTVERTDEEVMQFADDLTRLCDEMENAEMFYRNCQHCNLWGRRCEYSSICLTHKKGQKYAEFTERERKE